MRFEGGTFGEGKFIVDGGVFINCKFSRTILVYKGGPPPNFDHCSFDDVRWFFDESAGNTLQLLRGLYASPFKGMVEKMFEFVTGNLDHPGQPE